jgi:cytochrome oxidase Cu insertion factor (SCO1/SenC/PrrC family)
MRRRRDWRGVAFWAALVLVTAVAGGVAAKIVGRVDTTSLSLPSPAVNALAQDGMSPVTHLSMPSVSLVDQFGQPVNLAGFRGKVVILTFLDPVCWLQCPMQAQDLKLVDRYLGARLVKRVELVAVVANPDVHSVEAIRQFDRMEGMDALPNWRYLTSASVSVLRRVWSHFYMLVQAPVNGMVDHTDAFYLVDPRGRVDDVSLPVDTRASYVGTAQLLAAYAERLMGVPTSLVSLAHPPTLPSLPKSPSLGPAGPVAVTMVNALDGWLVDNELPYQVLLTTHDAGQSWTDVGPPGYSQRGGLYTAFGAAGTAWAVVRPYGYMTHAVSFVTADFGETWYDAQVVAAAIPSDALDPLTTGTGSRAWLLTRSGVLVAKAGGDWTGWLPVPARLPSHVGLSLGADGRPWLSGGGLGRPALLVYEAGRWHTVPLPVPPPLQGLTATTLPPVWHGAEGYDGVVVSESGGHQLLVVDVSRDGGRRWTVASSAVAVRDPWTGGVAMTAPGAWAITEAGRLARWSASDPAWRVVGSVPSGLGAITVGPAGIWGVARGAGGPDVLYRQTVQGWERLAVPDRASTS